MRGVKLLLALGAMGCFVSGAWAGSAKPDETLQGDILFWGIPVGKGIVEIWHQDRYDGRPARRIVAQGQTAGVFDWFYRVRDRVESYSDPESGLPYAFLVDFEEGRYRRKQQFRFDQAKRIIEGPQGTLCMQQDTWDPLSALFLLRRIPLEAGKKILGHVSDGRKIYPLEAVALRKERRKVLRQWKDCWMLELKTGSVPLGGIMGPQKFRRFSSWFTDDADRTPVHAQGDLFIGSVSAELKAIKA